MKNYLSILRQVVKTADDIALNGAASKKSWSPQSLMMDDIAATDPAEVNSRRMDFIAKIATLTPDEQKVIYGRYYAKETLDETAKRVGFSRSKVHEIEMRALSKLTEMLDSYDPRS